MNSDQYEELCRQYLADQTGLPLNKIESAKLANPKRPDLPEFKHQIDLYWETGDAIALYRNIANAKWRGSVRVDQPDVLLLQQVRESVGAHKAFLITNVGFTAGAIAAAKHHGIALHVVKPDFDTSRLPPQSRVAIQGALREIASQPKASLYSFHIEQRGMVFSGQGTVPGSTAQAAVTPSNAGYRTRAIQSVPQSTAGPMGNRSVGLDSGPKAFTRGGGFEKK